MRQPLIFLLTLNFACFGIGRRIELLRFNQALTVPADDFIPVYSAVEDFSVLRNSPREGAADLFVLEPIESAAAKRAELRTFDSLSSLPESEISEYEPLDSTVNSEARNFQSPQVSTSELRSFQSLPALGAPELQNYPALPMPAAQTPTLANFQLPAIARSALNSRPLEENEAASSGRTFKHFLLLKSLLGNGGGGGGGYGGPGSGGFGGTIYPIIVNTPVNVTNWNNNTLTNTPAAAAAAAGAAANDDVMRIQYIGFPQAPSVPMQMPMPAQVYHQPTPVYQQRQAVATAQPTYAVAMLNIPGTSSFMPFPMPQYPSPVNRNNEDVERRHALGWSNAAKNQNPWSAFANNLRGLQFL